MTDASPSYYSKYSDLDCVLKTSPIIMLVGCTVGLHDIWHVIFNAHLVSKARPVISGNFHYVRDFTWNSIQSRCSLTS